MGRMKDFAMDVSNELGYDGELNDEVLEEAQRRLDEESQVLLTVRTGEGTVLPAESSFGDPGRGEQFTDTVEHVSRCPRQHSGWESVRYKGKRYQLKGGIRTGPFICLNNPILGGWSAKSPVVSPKEIASVP